MGKRALPAQTSLSSRGQGRGGFRAAAGRPPKAESDRLGHHPRPELAARFPVHVTMRRVADGPAFRRGDCYAVLRRCFAAGKSRFGFRLVHYSVQGNHIHLICEADDRRALSRGMQGLTVRIARRLNRRLGRRGKLFAQRYHARILRSPREVRHALIYVLNNRRHHAESALSPNWIDPCSSGPWFTGWRRTIRLHWAKPQGDPPVVPPGTWLLEHGWRVKRGLLRFDEAPAGAGPAGRRVNGGSHRT